MEDLISQLPDELLQVILFNVSTRDSVRNSLLSTRWRNLWNGVPRLHLIGHVCSNIGVENFVDRFLNLHKESPIYQFTLTCNKDKKYTDADGYSLNWLIDKVITHGVECFAIDGSISYRCYPRVVKVPVSLYKCETLVHLWLESVKLNDCEDFYLPRLETMHLDCVLFHSELVLEELILCSPVLQALSIHYTTLGHFTLRSQTVKRLSLRRSFFSSSSSDDGVVIDIPTLEILCIRDDLLENFRLESLSSSIKMCLDVSAGAGMHNFFAGFSGVTDLSISGNTLEGLYLHSQPQQLPNFENLTHLKACLYSGFSEMLPMFLSSCPNLKSLDLWLYGYPNVEKIVSSLVPQCFLTSINYIHVKMTPHVLQERSRKVEIEFAKYILEIATVLKKLTLWFDGEEDESSSVLQRILTFPNRSLVEVKMNQRPAKFQIGYGFEFKPVFDPIALFYSSTIRFL